MNDTNKLFRPGISHDYLHEAGIKYVEPDIAHKLCGVAEAGIYIPYNTLHADSVNDQGGKYGRLRLEKPKGDKKYHQRSNTGVHVYLPPGLNHCAPGCDLHVVEGEFKALSLMEAGFPAVGISGFYGFASDNKLVSELNEVIHHLRPNRILFVGDSDTAINYQFSDAAIKFSELLDVPVALPRIPLNGPGKGIDDCRQTLGENFDKWWEKRIRQAIEITQNIKRDDIIYELLNGEIKQLAKLQGQERIHTLRKIAELAYHSGSIAKGEITNLVVEILSVGKRQFQQSINEIEKNYSSEPSNNECNVDDIIALVKSELFYYDKNYFRYENNDCYEPISRVDALLHVRKAGLSNKCNGVISEAENALYEVQRENLVSYAGAFCGRPAGIYEENGHKILATSSPKIIEAQRGDATNLTNFFANLLGKNRDPLFVEQWMTFLGWLKHARAALMNHGQHLPGQVLGFIGPADCGKSLAQQMITYLLGGRSSDSSLWLTGKVNFNYDMWFAEHIILSDDNLSGDYRERCSLRDNLKKAVANESYPLHRKYGDLITQRPIWRITLSANDDDSSNTILPPLDDSFKDKIILIKCYPPTIPFFGETEEDRQHFFNQLINELPAFLYQVESLELPAEYKKGRFGVMEFHHPAIVEIINQISPLTPFAEVIHEWTESWTQNEFSGPATKHYRELSQYLCNGHIRDYSNNAGHFGKQLSGLSRMDGWKKRISKEPIRFGNNQKQTIWIIRKKEEIALTGYDGQALVHINA